MTDKNWTVMNDLQEAFDQITSFSFLLEQLQEAVDANETQKIVDITAALNAFYVPYCDNFDKKFSKAWDTIIKEQ
jgi:allophanate hydrolase subunit 1